MDVPRPARSLNPAAKLKDAANTEAPQLSFQRKAVQDFYSRHANRIDDPAAASATALDLTVPSPAGVHPTPQNKRDVSLLSEGDGDSGGDHFGLPVPGMSPIICPYPSLYISSS